MFRGSYNDCYVRGNESPQHHHKEKARGSLSWNRRAFIPLDSGHVLPCDTACTWHRTIIYGSTVLLLSTCLCHFPNYIRNGLWSGLCLYIWLSGHAWHLTIRFWGPQKTESIKFSETESERSSEKKDLCASSKCPVALKDLEAQQEHVKLGPSRTF